MVRGIETLIVGAGVVGSSVAMHLAKMGMSNIRVIDFDLEGSLSSSELNAGGVRATWNQPINIEMSKISIDYFATISEEVGYKASGYLWLHPKERFQKALKARERQFDKNWPVEVWDVPQLRNRIPFLDKTDGIEGAIFAQRDGLINPNLLKNHFRNEARKLGVQFDDRTLLREVRYVRNSPEGHRPEVHRIEAVAERFAPQLSQESKIEILTSTAGNSATERTRVEYHTQRIINCAGPWSSRVARIMGYPCPSIAVRRQICIFDSRDIDLTPYGMIIDTSGVYFHPEASNGLAGFASPEPPGMNYHYDGESFFENIIWPALYERSTYFEKLKHLTGFAGLYEVSPDESAILGQVTQGEAGRSESVFEAHSFSGHGVMHSYSAGKLLAERIIRGRYETIDAELLSATRFETGKLVHENLVI